MSAKGRRTSNTLVKTSDYIPTIGKDDSAITYENAVVSEYEVYAIYIGGNSSYHSFVIMGSNWFVKPTTV